MRAHRNINAARPDAAGLMCLGLDVFHLVTSRERDGRDASRPAGDRTTESQACSYVEHT